MVITTNEQKQNTKINNNRKKFNSVFQLGGLINLLEGNQLNNKTIYCSYHDSNLAARLNQRPDVQYDQTKKYYKKGLEYEKHLYNHLDLIFTMSNWIRDSFIEDFACEPKKIFTVGAGANIVTKSSTVENDYSNNEILFVGLDFERKGGEALLKAFEIVKREIPDAKLRVIGPDSAELHSKKDVIAMGRIMKHSKEGLEKLQEAYMNASIFVMPTLWEPFGIVFLEAMANKLPCIGVNKYAMPEIIENGKTGFVIPPNNIERLAYSIIDLLKDKKSVRSSG